MLARVTYSRGQVLPLMAILIAVLFGFAAFAVDVGYLRYQQRLQQSATDSAALAGAGELAYSGSDYAAAAKSDAASNGFTDGVNDVAITVNHGPASGSYVGNTQAVEVLLTAQYHTFFMGIFNGLGTVTISTRAVARRTDASACLYLLSPSADSNINDATIEAPECGIVINQSGSINMHGATIDAKSIAYAGDTPNEKDATFASATPAPSLPVSDPCMQIAGCAYLTNNPPSLTSCSAGTYKGNGTLQQGCYDNLDIHGQTVFLNPGVYIITGTLNGSKSTISGNGVTFYITGNGSLNLAGATLDLSAPTTGDEAGVLMYQKSSDTNAANIEGASCGGCTSTISGLLYFPSAFVNYNHSGGGYTVDVFGAANFNKSESDYAAPPTGGALVTKAVLAE
jgi:Putative Flp pilus-assembly TadE/G-like